VIQDTLPDSCAETHLSLFSSFFFFFPSFFFLFSLFVPQEAHVALAFQGASWTSEYAFPLMLMQTILGSWDRTSALGRNAASKYVETLLLLSPLLLQFSKHDAARSSNMQFIHQ
jgi:hypothetical protein